MDFQLNQFVGNPKLLQNLYVVKSLGNTKKQKNKGNPTNYALINK